jgi:hypothetical protein
MVSTVSPGSTGRAPVSADRAHAVADRLDRPGAVADRHDIPVRLDRVRPVQDLQVPAVQ